MRGPSQGRRFLYGAVAGIAILLLVGTAAGASSTAVTLSPTDPSMAVDETTTVAVAVENADGGVGATNLTVTVSDPGVATIESVTVEGNPSLEEKTVSGSDRAVVRSAVADTQDTGSVTFLRVTLAGESAGETTLQIDAHTLADESGATYAITDTDTATIAVTQPTTTTTTSTEPTTTTEQTTTAETTTETTATTTAGADGDGTTESESPGLGAPVAVIGLLGAGLLVRRRL